MTDTPDVASQGDAGASGGRGDVRFTLIGRQQPYYKIPFADSVDAVINNTYAGNGSVFMRDTPRLFVDMGFSRLPIMTTVNHVKSIYSAKQTAEDHNHDLGELIKQIPEKLENPLMVITSATRPYTSVVAILELVDKGENPVIVSILLDGISQCGKIDAHIMTSAYGKKNIFSGLVKNAVKQESNGKSSVLYAQKKAESIVNAEGVQFPNSFAFDSVNHNITDVGLKVKQQTEILQFKKWFADSKVVDENGEPLVVYHGTNADFYSFDTENGAWFSKSPEYAESMTEERSGNRIIQCYLSIKNPMTVKVPPQQFAADTALEKSLIKEAKKKGHDGLIIENDTDNELEKDVFYVAFRPAQIKSATDNVGTFDPKNPDIRFAIIGEVEARNARKRKNMTTEEKRQSLLAETEDVAEESKIYIYGNGGGRSEMADGQTEAFAVNQENDGSLTFFSNVNNKSSLKDQRAARDIYAALNKVIENAVFYEFRKSDGAKKHNDVNGQYIYKSAFRIGEQFYATTIILNEKKNTFS